MFENIEPARIVTSIKKQKATIKWYTELYLGSELLKAQDFMLVLAEKEIKKH
jgi:hypothetical protein